MNRAITGVFILFLGCKEPLVNESYGSVNHESINGFDLMLEHLTSKYDVQNALFLDAEKMSQYDLIIYFHRDLASHDSMIELDRQITRMVRPEEEAAVDDSDGNIQELDTVRGDANGSFNRTERPVALLIFQRGTTASTPFWSLQWTGLSPEKKRARDFVADRIRADDVPEWLPESSFFFERRLLAKKPFEKRIYYDRTEQAAYQGRSLPARIPAGLAILPVETAPIPVVYRRCLACFSTGSYFIEATIPGAYLFLVSDSAPFLNYHMMRKDNVALLDFVIARSMKYRPRNSEGKPKILILDRLLTRKERMQEERSLFSVFLQPPWSIPAALLLLLFIMFVWSRLLRDRPVTEIEPESREGDLMRHFDGVGRRIAAISYRNRRLKK